MDTRIIKFAITTVSICYTVYLFSKGSIGAGVGMILVSALLAVFLFRSLRLIFVFLQMRKQDYAKAQRWLDRVNPDKLWKKQRGYFHFLSGSVEMGVGNITSGEKHFKRALSLGLRMNHDKAAAKLSLAMAAMARQKKREAMHYINEAKKLDKKGVLKKDIKMVEQAMKKPQKVIRQRR